MDIFNQLESNVRGYCRSFPVVFTKAQNALLTDSEGNEYSGWRRHPELRPQQPEV